jgi:hypothetical protein
MKKKIVKQPSLAVLVWAFFLASRLFIWVFQPASFSEIIYSYMPYAHLWASGVVPYREQWYEYPPATIPLFYAPHVIDRETHPFWWHQNYSQAYRLILLAVDVGLFWLLWQWWSRHEWQQSQWVAAALFYILATMKAHEFMYDTMDWVFVAAWTLSLVAGGVGWRAGPFWEWLGYWLAVGLKYVNGPVGWWLALSKVVTHWKQGWASVALQAVIGGVAFLVVWGLPLALFRSSLSVSLVYHQLRGIQIDSTYALIARTVTEWTHTEKFIEVYKNYEVAGPFTDSLKTPASFIFAGSMLSVLALGSWLIWRQKVPTSLQVSKAHMPELLAWLSLGYVLVFLVTGKVLSRPFLLWLIPLLCLINWKDTRAQAKFLLTALFIITITLSPASNMRILTLPLPLWIGWGRCLGLSVMLWWWVRESVKSVKS